MKTIVVLDTHTLVENVRAFLAGTPVNVVI